MKNILKASFAVVLALVALSASSNAQTVEMNGLGSSALFLELGLAASSPTINNGLGATCVWSTSTSGIVVATDNSLGTSNPKTDSGSAWVAWTPTSGSCSTVGSTTQIWAYLQTDSVVGNRCLFNKCTIANTGSGSSPANLILAAGASPTEVALPAAIATALNGRAGSTVNIAGTDIRPEDAEFAMTRATSPCGVSINGSQYLGLGYNPNGSTPIQSNFGGSPFNVLPFSLPSAFVVTPVGATPIVVVVNGDGTQNGFSNSNITNITSNALAFFLDGTYSYTSQALTTPSTSGAPATVLIREPVSGTYNTMEYNVPNTVGQQTSQDVGLLQPSTQQNCSGTSVLANPMNLATASGGARQRAIGTGQELSEVLAVQNSLGYGFWSVANFAHFTGTGTAQNAKYLTVDGIDPLLKVGTPYTGALPITGSAELANVTLPNVVNGSYPIWSLLRLVSNSTVANTNAGLLSTATQKFVSFTTPTSRPDFITVNDLAVVRSHFIPPAGTIQPASAANGNVGLPSSSCTTPEAGGDVGGVVFTLSADSTFCQTNPAGETGHRR